MNRRVLALAVILATVGIAIGMVLEPALATVLGTGVAAVSAVGVAMILVGYLRYRRPTRNGDRYYDPGEPETPVTVPTPGATQEDQWDEHRLKTVAIEVIARHYGCTENEANAYLETGQWTADPAAAAHFAPERSITDAEIPALRNLPRERWQEVTRERAVNALTRLTQQEKSSIHVDE